MCNLSRLEYILSNLYFYDIVDYAYDYKDVLPEVSALEMLRYGPGGGLPVKDEFDLQTVDRLRYQKMQADNLPSVEESKRALVQNRLIGMKTSDLVIKISSNGMQIYVINNMIITISINYRKSTAN